MAAKKFKMLENCIEKKVAWKLSLQQLPSTHQSFCISTITMHTLEHYYRAFTGDLQRF